MSSSTIYRPINLENHDSTRKENSRQPLSDSRERRHGTVQEALEELQSGEVVGHGGFVPQRFLDRYMFGNDEKGNHHYAEKMEELTEKLVDRILVLTPSDINQLGVQMKLVQNVLDGAEVWMKREREEISIIIKSKTNRSNKFISNKAEDLIERLEQKLNLSVCVSIEKLDTDNSLFNN